MEETNFSVEEFISNPSRASEEIIAIISSKIRYYEEFLGQKNILKIIGNRIQTRVWYLEKPNQLYEYAIRSGKEDLSGCPLRQLHENAEISFENIAMNNFLLTYSFCTEDAENKIQKLPLTKEAEKNIYLKRFHCGTISRKEFDSMFGHYALNPFELSSRRFKEYSNAELRKIAGYSAASAYENNINLGDMIANNPSKRYAVYAGLREELKYSALKIISEMRSRLLKIEKEKNIKNIFDMSYKEIERLA